MRIGTTILLYDEEGMILVEGLDPLLRVVMVVVVVVGSRLMLV